jgi:hypothetical protein
LRSRNMYPFEWIYSSPCTNGAHLILVFNLSSSSRKGDPLLRVLYVGFTHRGGGFTHKGCGFTHREGSPEGRSVFDSHTEGADSHIYGVDSHTEKETLKGGLHC